MNTQITEDYVSFETAKLLKEKGYKGSFNGYYNNTGCVVDKPNTILKEPKYQYYERVSLYMAMKWLREVHHIHANPIRQGNYDDTFEDYSWIVARDGIIYRNQSVSESHSYEEACEAAIKYCLTNLI